MMTLSALSSLSPLILRYSAGMGATCNDDLPGPRNGLHAVMRATPVILASTPDPLTHNNCLQPFELLFGMALNPSCA